MESSGVMGRPSVVPLPWKMSVGDGHFALSRDAGVRGPAGVMPLARRLLGLTGSGAEFELTLTDDGTLGAEGYHLRVSEAGVRATANTPDGLRWAIQTVRQLVDDGRVPHVDIVDLPRHSWRGSLLDVARWYQPLSFLHRYVDLLAMHKLNTLHLHLTDDQGWRFEVRGYPRLAEIGGFRAGSSAGHRNERRTDGVPHGGYYPQSELRGLVAYAADLGVRVMPEVDAPGHMQAAIAAYPWLGNSPERALSVRQEWGISSHVLNVSDEAVSFMRQVLDEVTDVFPNERVHIGGDEVPAGEWAGSPAALSRVAAEGLPGPEHLQNWWCRQLVAHLSTHGRRAGVWDELLDNGAPDGVTVFAWRGVDRVAQALRAGHDVVAAPREYTYLDYSESDGPDEPLAIGTGLPLDEVYGYRPQSGVSGVQGQLWTEYLPTPELIEWRALPRLAAIAETGWCSTEPDLADFRRRLTGLLPAWDRMGLNYRPLST